MDIRIAADPPLSGGAPCQPAAEEGARPASLSQGSVPASALERARRAAWDRLGVDRSQAPFVGQPGQTGYAESLVARPAPSPAIRLASAKTAPARAQGYAPAPTLLASATSSSATSSSAASTSKATTTTSSTSASASSTKSDFAFLSDKKLSIEDKLFQFMLTVQKKEDQQLQKKMKQYADQYGTQSSSSSSSSSKTSTASSSSKAASGGGLLGGLLEDVVGGALSILGLGGSGSPLSVLGDLVSELGGTVLAGALTAVGLPELVPIASSVAGALGGALQGAAASSSSASSGSASTSKSTGSQPAKSSSSSATTPSSPSAIDGGDERMDMLEIQQMVEKQNQMFQLISNVLAGMNDTALNVIANVR